MATWKKHVTICSSGLHEVSRQSEYTSKTIVIKLEKYRNEFYVTLYKLTDSEKDINIILLVRILVTIQYVKLIELNRKPVVL